MYIFHALISVLRNQQIFNTHLCLLNLKMNIKRNSDEIVQNDESSKKIKLCDIPATINSDLNIQLSQSDTEFIKKYSRNCINNNSTPSLKLSVGPDRTTGSIPIIPSSVANCINELHLSDAGGFSRDISIQNTQFNNLEYLSGTNAIVIPGVESTMVSSSDDGKTLEQYLNDIKAHVNKKTSIIQDEKDLTVPNNLDDADLTLFHNYGLKVFPKLKHLKMHLYQHYGYQTGVETLAYLPHLEELDLIVRDVNSGWLKSSIAIMQKTLRFPNLKILRLIYHPYCRKLEEKTHLTNTGSWLSVECILMGMFGNSEQMYPNLESIQLDVMQSCGLSTTQVMLRQFPYDTWKTVLSRCNPNTLKEICPWEIKNSGYGCRINPDVTPFLLSHFVAPREMYFQQPLLPKSIVSNMVVNLNNLINIDKESGFIIEDRLKDITQLTIDLSCQGMEAFSSDSTSHFRKSQLTLFDFRWTGLKKIILLNTGVLLENMQKARSFISKQLLPYDSKVKVEVEFEKPIIACKFTQELEVWKQIF